MATSAAVAPPIEAGQSTPTPMDEEDSSFSANTAIAPPAAALSPPTLESCIFCNNIASSFEDNLKHMTISHSFFVPDLEYIDNLEGLITFLQKKVYEDCLCIYCNGKGRGFATSEAVRKHMIDKGHCMIDYSEEGQDEVSEFFDFTSSYPDWEDVDG